MRHLLLILLLVATSCIIPNGSPRRPHTKKRPRPVKSMRAEAINYIDKDFAALATPDNAVNMAFKIGGQIDTLPVSKGNFVSQGELLIGLDPLDVELQVTSDISAYNEAQSKLERMERLYSHQAVSAQDVESAQATFVRAQSTYENSKELLSQTRLFAPFNGVVERVYIDNYQRVNSGESVVRIVSANTTQVEFTIAQHLLSQLSSPTTKFSVNFLQYPNIEFEATLKEFARSSSDGSGIPVAVSIKNPDIERYVISPGLPCNVTMTLLESDKELISIPLSAIYAPAAGGDYVWVIDSENQVKLRPVELDIAYGNQSVLIKKGIESGEFIVTAGVYQLHDGEEVRRLN
ncbi:MAG: efflux RND transporter periplasmic adaptor subunit [Rikenellaceae bacterium]